MSVILSGLWFLSTKVYRCIFIYEHKTYRGLEDVRVSVLTPNFISVGYEIDIIPHNKCTWKTCNENHSFYIDMNEHLNNYHILNALDMQWILFFFQRSWRYKWLL